MTHVPRAVRARRWRRHQWWVLPLLGIVLGLITTHL